MSGPDIWTGNTDLRSLVGALGAGLACDTTGAPPEECNWLAIITLALEHGAGGLLHRAVVRGKLPAFPAALKMVLLRHGEANMLANAALLAELHRLRGTLSAAGVDTIPLKGVSLCQRLYGDLSSRTSRDIDFLVRENAREHALAVLATDGYTMRPALPPRQLAAKANYAGQFLMHRADGAFAIEPHWAIAPRTLALRIDHAALWQRCRESGPGGMGLPMLAAEDEFIMLCVHGFKEEWGRLKLIADLAQFVSVHPSLDWDAVEGRARQQRVWWIVLVGLSVIAIVFAIRPPVSGSVAQPERAARQALGKITQAAATRSRVPADVSIYQVSALRRRMREDRLDRFRYVWRTVTTPREVHFRALPMPDRLFPAYAGVKLLHDYVLLPCWLSGKWAHRVLMR